MLKHSDIKDLRTLYEKLVEAGVCADVTKCDSETDENILSNEASCEVE